MTGAAVLRIVGTCAIVMRALAAAGQPADLYGDCRDRFARDPHDYDSAYCFYEVTFQHQHWDEGERLFDALMAEHPENFWIPLAAGHVYRTRDPDRAEGLYRRAAAGFERANHAEGEILARSNLRNFLFPKDGRAGDAAIEMQRVAEIGATVDDPLLKARAWVVEGAHVQEVGEDLGFAYRLLKQAEAVVFPDGPYRLQRSCLIALGGVAYRLGRLDDALAVFRRLEALAAREGEIPVQANARYNLLTTAMLKERLLPTPGAAPALLHLAEESLETAIAAQNPFIELRTHLALAELLAIEEGTRAAALAHVTRCLDLAIRSSQPDDEAICAWKRALLLHDRDAAAARAAEQQARAADARASSPVMQAYAAGHRIRLSWEAYPRAQAIEESLTALDTIERLRDLQDTAESSAELFSTWTPHYYWLSGRLLNEAREEEVDLALSITERMRARALLDALARSRTPLDPASPAVLHRLALADEIARVQRKLLDPALDDAERRALLADLERLELDEREARRQVSLASARTGNASGAPLAGLGEIQTALAPNEALLSFQVGLWETFEGTFGGGSWLIVLTREGRSVHRLPDRVRLASMVPILTGLVEREDGLERTAAVRLYEELLAEAVRALPPDVERLILIPDGALHHLPFDVLREHPEAVPLAARYELVVAPSATLWLHWRTVPRPAGARALALADPAIDSAAGESDVRNAALRQGLRLGRLPHARRESRAMARHYGAVDAFVGEHASERALKEADLQRYGILHFAAHAVADEVHPERSAVLLAAGDEREDGLLQAREIERLDLAGRVVVLSACRTASGAVLSGEGVLSLARAFFGAGAVSVIGNRWPIRDEDAALLFDAFYRAVGNGASLSSALQHARLAAIDAGRPASVWASLVLLGEGDVRLLPDGREAAPSITGRQAAIAVFAALLVAVALFGSARRRQ